MLESLQFSILHARVETFDEKR